MSNVKRRIVMGIAALSVCVLLAATAYAFGLFQVELLNNYFHTGTVDVEIAFVAQGDGPEEPFNPEVPLYEPGMTVRRDFIVTNYSTDENGVWCRLYFTGLDDGLLVDVMEAKIYDSGTLLCAGKVSEWTNAGFMTEPFVLENKASKTLTLELHYPESAGNETQAGTMSFALAVTATQRTANPDGEY